MLRLVFYVQHLLGIGHLARSLRIVDALTRDGWEVSIVAGGVIPNEFAAGRRDIIQLPPVKAGSGLTSLVHPDGMPFDGAAQERRRDMLLAHVERQEPDILVTEAFPFGRRQMRFELLPLLEQAKARRDPPLIVSSIRDILQENRRPERIAETLNYLDRFFDVVLVHGDPSMVRLERSFPAAETFSAKIAYTGLVGPNDSEKPLSGDRYDVVVSVGGGAVGEALLRAALAARPMTRLAHGRWLFLTGPNFPSDTRREIERDAGAEAVVIPFTAELASVLRQAALSISQAGYNTVSEILAAGVRAVLVPYAAGGETEQTVRASLLTCQNRVVMLEEAELTPATLARSIDQALDQRPQAATIDLEGARTTSSILQSALRTR